MIISKKKLQLAMAMACMGFVELAEAAGLSRSTMYSVSFECRASAKTLGKIAKALGVDPAEILEDE